jgi:hypothetical protein
MRSGRLSKYAQDTAHAAFLAIIIILFCWLGLAYVARQCWRSFRDDT